MNEPIPNLLFLLYKTGQKKKKVVKNSLLSWHWIN